MSEIQVQNMSDKVAVKRPGFFTRVLWLFTSPGRLMEELAQKPRVLFWLIAGGVAIVLPFIARMPLYEDFLRKTMLSQSDYMESFGFEMTPEMIEASMPASIVGGLVGAPFGAWAGLPIIALIFFAILKVMGGKGSFKAYLSVAVHANIIMVLYYLILIPISYITGSLHQSASLTSLGSLVAPEETNPYLFGLLVGLDIFAIWRFAVMAIGFTAVSELKKKHVYIVTATVFIIGLIYGIFSMPAALQLLQ